MNLRPVKCTSIGEELAQTNVPSTGEGVKIHCSIFVRREQSVRKAIPETFLKDLLTDDTCSDVTISTNEKSFSVHKAILSGTLICIFSSN